MTEPALPGQSIDVPVVPELAEAWGYRGTARFVAFYYDAASEHLRHNDGISDGQGHTWAWQLYTRHRSVEPLLRQFDLSSFDSELCLMLDREANRASIASGDQAAQFLREHRQPLPPSPPMSGEQPRSLVEQITTGWEEVAVDQEAVRRAMAEQRGRVGRLMSWLDMCPDARKPELGG